jgi:hypothetical protein
VAAAFGLVLLHLAVAAQAAGTSCSTGEAAVAELRAVHEAARRAHLEGDAKLMAPAMAEQMVSASNGELMANTRQQTLNFFEGYFARVKYLEWSDAAPPTVTVSPDGRMGWMAVKVRARYLDRTTPDAGEKTFKSSWIATYYRDGCAWQMTGIASAVVSE